MNEQLIAKAIRFKGIGLLFDRHIMRHREDLPSASQWHRLKGYVLTEGIEKTAEFLKERNQKKKVQKEWSLVIEEEPFHQWLATRFVKPVQDAADHQDLAKGGYRDLGFSMEVPQQLLRSEFETIKTVAFKKALCELIDRVLLCQGEDGLTFRADLDNGKMEVMHCV